MPFRSCLVGELYADTNRGSDAVTALTDGTAEFVCFAVPWWMDQYIPRASLPQAAAYARDCGIKFAEFYASVEVGWKKETLDAFALRMGWEGFVLKNANYHEWWKCKPVKTVDCVVVGIKPGKGKFLGMVGALIVACEGTEIASVSGMTDDQRLEMTQNDPVGKVCEVAYQYVGSGGRLRHPRFMRWRDDKPAEQCLLAQLETHR